MKKEIKDEKDVIENKVERAKNALELSRELFMLTGNVNYYNLYKAIENPKIED